MRAIYLHRSHFWHFLPSRSHPHPRCQRHWLMILLLRCRFHLCCHCLSSTSPNDGPYVRRFMSSSSTSFSAIFGFNHDDLRDDTLFSSPLSSIHVRFAVAAAAVAFVFLFGMAMREILHSILFSPKDNSPLRSSFRAATNRVDLRKNELLVPRDLSPSAGHSHFAQLQNLRTQQLSCSVTLFVHHASSRHRRDQVELDQAS